MSTFARRTFQTSATLIALSLFVGCYSRSPVVNSPTGEPSVAEPQSSSNILTFDFGTVLEGQLVTHEFRYVNSRDVPLTIRDDHDIRANCGCSKLLVSPRSLAPGDAATITVGIQTSGRPGRFQQGGTVFWRDPAGGPEEVKVQIAGLVTPPVSLTPSQVAFGVGEVDGSAVRVVSVIGPYPIDWESVTVTAESDVPGFQAEKLPANSRGRQIAIRCTLAAGVEAVAGTCRISGRLAASSKVSPGESFDARVPLTATARVALIAQPTVVALRLDPQTRGYTLRLLVRGSDIEARPDPVEAVAASGCNVEWKVNRSSGGQSAILDVVLRPQAGDRPNELSITSRSGRRLGVQLIWPQP